ncbi:MAG: M1 family metallopeptidase [Haliscomenobacter sp.]|uniref:M1 family metallopeptidase n=1 Tax=Haliscomenobacter sp. TaxID=2717303 RepID=UPI0029B9B18E|nr:M1 family metallopeptidase [Haliscomenobacter sp.]MDX2069512.1 M1 family metallopeptidase [Haliscomenobacter sp.]
MSRKIPTAAGFLLCSTITLLAQNSLSTTSPIDIDHYKIELQFDWTKKQANAEVIISMAFTQAARSIQLAAHDLLIYTVRIGAKKELAFTLDTLTHRLNVSLDKNYQPGEKLDLSITYQTLHHNEPDPNTIGGSFGKGIRFFQPTASNPIKRKQLWVQSELQNTAYWLPCSPNPTDLSTTEFIATLDPGLTFVANGILLEKKDNQDGRVTFHYEASRAYPIYLAAFVAGDYVDLVQTTRGIPLHTFCYPDEQEAARATTVRLPDMLQFLEDKTGFAYPYLQYAQVMVQDYPFPSLIGQNSFSIISDNMIDDYGTHQDYLYLWDGVEFNALASQWFGNLIMPKTVEDIWLAKGFAQYFEGLYAIAENGIEEYLLWGYPWESGSVFGDWANGNRHPIVPTRVEDPESFAADSYAKYRGALVLRMLRKELGDEAFFKAIQSFVKEYAFKLASTQDFQNAVKKASGKDLQWFFEQWIYQTGHPVFELSSSFDAKTKQYHLHVKQIQQKDSTATYAQVNFFQGKMEIEIDGKKQVIYLKPQRDNHFTFRLPSPPKMLNFDVEQTWIKEIQWSKTREEWLQLFLHSKDMSARNTAMTELAEIAKAEGTTASDRNSIIQAFQQVTQSLAYWRFRFNVIGQLRSIQTPPYDQTTTQLWTSLVKKGKSWVKAAALSSLGMTNDPQHADLYVSCLADTSDRVVNAAAVALGKTKTLQAFEALVKLKDRPSWKNQSLMHCLAGLAQLGDARAEAIAVAALVDNQSPRWFLGNGWDYPFVAAQTLATLGKTEKAYPILLERFNLAMQEKNSDDIFHQVLLIATLGNPQGLEIFAPLKSRYQNDPNAMNAILAFEEQLNAAAGKKN